MPHTCIFWYYLPIKRIEVDLIFSSLLDVPTVFFCTVQSSTTYQRGFLLSHDLKVTFCSQNLHFVNIFQTSMHGSFLNMYSILITFKNLINLAYCLLFHCTTGTAKGTVPKRYMRDVNDINEDHSTVQRNLPQSYFLSSTTPVIIHLSYHAQLRAITFPSPLNKWKFSMPLLPPKTQSQQEQQQHSALIVHATLIVSPLRRGREREIKATRFPK